MLELLHEAERELPDLLRDVEGWSSLLVDYHPPFVERVFRSFREHRLYLHCIQPCAAGEALFHPHPWPSAMRVCSGTYEMGIGYGKGDVAPPIATRLVASGPMEYEMIDRDAWHYVRPIGGVAVTVMLSGPPWQRSAPRADKPLGALDPTRVRELLDHYRALYA